MTHQRLDFKEFTRRFNSLAKPSHDFMTRLKDIDNRLDCCWNKLEGCWMVIMWLTPNKWDWVMSLKDKLDEPYPPGQACIDKVRELKFKWTHDLLLQEIEKDEQASEAAHESKMENVAHCFAADIRKTLIADYDGVVTTLNPFL